MRVTGRRSRRRMSSRVSQPLRSTSAQAGPKRARAYPVIGAAGRTRSRRSSAAARALEIVAAAGLAAGAAAACRAAAAPVGASADGDGCRVDGRPLVRVRGADEGPPDVGVVVGRAGVAAVAWIAVGGACSRAAGGGEHGERECRRDPERCPLQPHLDMTVTARRDRWRKPPRPPRARRGRRSRGRRDRRAGRRRTRRSWSP